MKDFLFRGKLADLDHDVHKLNTLEAERQFRKLILIPSESTASMAVREALSSAFQNVYAEGYPDEETRWMSEDEIHEALLAELPTYLPVLQALRNEILFPERWNHDQRRASPAPVTG